MLRFSTPPKYLCRTEILKYAYFLVVGGSKLALVRSLKLITVKSAVIVCQKDVSTMPVPVVRYL